ncbi:hypothetical protein LTR07_002517 [Exophiala xenobiotica]|nr:hypothetical protein LTR07_002517 [Exophiala xenobiotica]
MDGAIIYRGSANIEIEILYFRSDKSGDPAHESNVERLATTFRNKGCQTTKLQNHIPVRIDQRLLNRALQNSRIPAERLVADTLGNYPKLEFPSGSRLECLHGQARVRAAIEVLPLGERRWTVDFYIVGPGLVATLVEEYANNEWHPGEIYHRMRRCHRQKNQGIDNLWFEKRWRAHLSCHEQRNVVALSHYDDIMSTCDDLLDAPGLRKDWRLTTWHKILSMRIEEYILNYLTSMKNFWYGIVQGDSEALQKVDEATVKALELMAPGACRADARTLRCQLDSGQIFGAFNGREREEIWVRVLDFTSDRLVPTFSSFFEDLNWFEHPIDCVKRLIHLGRRETIVSALGRMFSDLNQQAGYCVIQRSEHTFVSAPGNRANRLDWGIRQIFISAMRNYPDMAPRPKKRDLLAKPKTKEADTTGLFEFAVLAHRLGFESPEIHELMDSPPPLSASKEHVTFVDDANPDTKVKRCGIPYGKHHQKDRPLLFLENLHDASIQELGEMSSWFNPSAWGCNWDSEL